MKYRKILILSILLFSQIINIAAQDDTQDDWLHVENAKIVDKDGKEVWLTGVNWFGYNTGSQVFDGVWSCIQIQKHLKLMDMLTLNYVKVMEN